jgi:hypothetical protein
MRIGRAHASVQRAFRKSGFRFCDRNARKLLI